MKSKNVMALTKNGATVLNQPVMCFHSFFRFSPLFTAFPFHLAICLFTCVCVCVCTLCAREHNTKQTTIAKLNAKLHNYKLRGRECFLLIETMLMKEKAIKTLNHLLRWHTVTIHNLIKSERFCELTRIEYLYLLTS